MLFITNRAPKQSIRSKANRNFTFDLDNNAPGNSLFFCERTGPEAYTEIKSENFFPRVKASDYRQVLMFIHGFNVMPEDAFEAAAELQELFDRMKPKEVQVVPLVWPCDNDFGIVKDYWDDQKAADGSAFAFSRLLDKFVAWQSIQENDPKREPCYKRINVLAHSMGNRVLRETLRAWNKYQTVAEGVPKFFRNVFMAAPDVLDETLEYGQPGELIGQSARNVVVYFAADDLALRASKVSNLRNKMASRRLGHNGPEDFARVPKNVYAVDCDEVNTRYDRPTGHTYFRSSERRGEPGAVFDHIWSVIDTGRFLPDDDPRRTFILRGD
jgi:esterase/lipase superfamily enzyme